MRRSEFFKKAGLAAISGPFLKKGMGHRDQNLIKPKRLKPGDTIALTAPGGIVHNESDFIRMREVLESFELKVTFGEFVRERFGYFAGRDYQRALDLNRFVADPDIAGIVAVRGGWGCSRILPYLDFELFRKNPKIFCGFSDVTTLNLAYLVHSGVVTFHGPNGTSDWSDFTRQSFKRILMDAEPATFESKSNVITIHPGTANGPVIGGNLTILTTSIGTSYQPDTGGCILFVEDISEAPYKIDRMLTHLKAAGLLNGIAGFIFGRCTDCPRPSSPGFTNEEVIRHHIKPFGVPAVVGMDIGHDPDNFTIPVGVQVFFDANKGIIELSEPAVI